MEAQNENLNLRKFEELKEEIAQAINQRLSSLPPEKDGYVLVDGFASILLQNEISGGLVIGGPTVPTIVIVGKTSGLIYTFALKVLLPKLIL